jgi:hypothetical protein
MIGKKREAMGHSALADLGQAESKLLGIFERFERGGRTITTASFAAHTGLDQQGLHCRRHFGDLRPKD